MKERTIMTNFKFIQKLDDEIQAEVNSEVDSATMHVRDQIDMLVTEAAYSATADIMERMNLEGLPADPEEIHDEIFQEVVDATYTELGIY